MSKRLVIAILVVAAATENHDNGKDDDPGAVIVKEMAEAVVIHSKILRCTFAIFGRSLYLMREEKKCYCAVGEIKNGLPG